MRCFLLKITINDILLLLFFIFFTYNRRFAMIISISDLYRRKREKELLLEKIERICMAVRFESDARLSLPAGYAILGTLENISRFGVSDFPPDAFMRFLEAWVEALFCFPHPVSIQGSLERTLAKNLRGLDSLESILLRRRWLELADTSSLSYILSSLEGTASRSARVLAKDITSRLATAS